MGLEQLSLFPTVYECNMRKKEIFKRQQWSENFITEENLQFVYESMDMMMELNMYVTTEIDWALTDFIRAGWDVESKYIEYAMETATLSIIDRYL
jgi:hypothetical protein